MMDMKNFIELAGNAAEALGVLLILGGFVVAAARSLGYKCLSAPAPRPRPRHPARARGSGRCGYHPNRSVYT